MAYINKADQAAASKRHYELNKEKMKERARLFKEVQREINRKYILELKTNSPCVDCKQTYHPVAMDFDHVTSDKITNIAKAVSIPWNLERIKAEIAKCELVCSNCHRVRTWLRAQG